MAFVMKLGRPSVVEKEVKTSQGSFWISVRLPTAAEGIADDALWLAKDFDRLSLNRLELIQGWREVKKEDGSVVPFTRPVLDYLLVDPEVRGAILQAVSAALHHTAMNGQVEKNSEAPPATG